MSEFSARGGVVGLPRECDPDGAAGERPAAPTCRACGQVSDGGPAAALSWVRDRGPDGQPRWLCPTCAREHLRAIESRLPDEWW